MGHPAPAAWAAGPGAGGYPTPIHPQLGPGSVLPVKKNPPGRKKRAYRRRNQKTPGGDPVSVLEQPDARTDKPRVTIIDEEPNRLTNPLVDAPREEGSGGGPLNAAELFVWPDLVYGRMDTFPLSYYARLLGFDISPEAPSKFPVAMNVDKLSLRRDIPSVPPLGTMVRLWGQQPGEDDDRLLDYTDPVYKAVCRADPKTHQDLKSAAIPDPQRKLSAPCLAMAKETLGVDSTDFQIKDALDYTVVAGGHSVTYQFVWFQLGETKEVHQNVAANSSIYGLPSAASSLRKPKVAELIFYVHHLGRSSRVASKEKVSDKDGEPAVAVSRVCPMQQVSWRQQID